MLALRHSRYSFDFVETKILSHLVDLLQKKKSCFIIMVSSKIISNFPKSDKRITSLCDWIGRIKNKKRDFRRNCRLNQNLRVSAVLTQALDRAENEMRIKQRERAQKWAEFTADVNIHIERNLYEEEAKQEQHRKDIEELWNGELNGLDNFIKNLSQIKTNVVRWWDAYYKTNDLFWWRSQNGGYIFRKRRALHLYIHTCIN